MHKTLKLFVIVSLCLSLKLRENQSRTNSTRCAPFLRTKIVRKESWIAIETRDCTRLVREKASAAVVTALLT